MIEAAKRMYLRMIGSMHRGIVGWNFLPSVRVLRRNHDPPARQWSQTHRWWLSKKPVKVLECSSRSLDLNPTEYPTTIDHNALRLNDFCEEIVLVNYFYKVSIFLIRTQLRQSPGNDLWPRSLTTRVTLQSLEVNLWLLTTFFVLHINY